MPFPSPPSRSPCPPCSMGVPPALLAAEMNSCIRGSNMKLLHLLLTAGADPNVTDYEKRCPMHVAASEGNLAAVRGWWQSVMHAASMTDGLPACLPY